MEYLRIVAGLCHCGISAPGDGVGLEDEDMIHIRQKLFPPRSPFRSRSWNFPSISEPGQMVNIFTSGSIPGNIMVSLNGKQKQPPHVRQRGNETEISCNFLDLLGIYTMIRKIFGKLFRRQTPLYSEPVVQELSDECRKLIQNYDRQQIPEFLYMPNAYKNGTIQRKSGICE